MPRPSAARRRLNCHTLLARRQFSRFVERRRLRLREEYASAVTHGAGLLVFLAAVPVLITLAVVHGSAAHVASFSLYGGSLVLLYAASTLYHAFRRPRVKRFFRVIDHVAIYLLIAGTYTPLAVVTLEGWLSGALLAVIWAIALIGCVFKIFCTGRYERLSVALYLGMGWLAVLVIGPVIESLPLAGFLWLLVGGLLYTGGVLFYAWQRLPYNHAVWHVFVLAASVCHFVAIARYAC
jgi:hemolysin III